MKQIYGIVFLILVLLLAVGCRKQPKISSQPGTGSVCGGIAAGGPNRAASIGRANMAGHSGTAS